MGRKPLYITTGRGVTDPLTGAGFSVTVTFEGERFRCLSQLKLRKGASSRDIEYNPKDCLSFSLDFLSAVYWGESYFP
jgi:hypothetical protein